MQSRQIEGLEPDRYMTISVHTISVHCTDHFRTMPQIGTLNHALLRDTVGPGDIGTDLAITYFVSRVAVLITKVKLKWGHAGEVSQTKKKLNKALNDRTRPWATGRHLP